MAPFAADTGDPRWMRRFHPADPISAGAAVPRLVVLPHAGGSASFYRPFSALLAPRLDVLTVQYPGRQDRLREPVIEDIAAYADGVRAALPTDGRPLALYGHSMGAVIAFEVARRLEADGAGPLALVVSGRRAPSVHREENIHLRDDTGLLAEVRALSVTDGRLLSDDELVRMILPALRGDYTAIERYGGSYAALSAPVLAVTGDADPWVDVAQARAWDRHTRGAFRLEVLSGSHFFIVEHIARMAELVTGFTLDSFASASA
ncbi:thioesterase II family protein [Streptomyces sp. NPDC015220]|uniref:thioesterase II family protein n=1 Tax=Streptomyces sp. NPDC015220 TaxID=3364947 RepID=UPI0036F8FA14